MAVAIVGCAAAWMVGTYDADRTDVQRWQAADVVLTRFDARAASLERSLEIDPLIVAPTSAAVSRIDRVGTDGRSEPRWPIGTLSPAAPVDSGTRIAMDIARDTGEPRAAAPVGETVVIAVAEYAGQGAPQGTAERRNRATGWRLATVHPKRLLDDIAMPPKAEARLAVAQPGLASAAATTVVVAGQSWQLAIDLPAASMLSVGAVAVLAMSLLGAALILALGIRARRAVRNEQLATMALQRETRTVAELGPLLQSSLDLAEVLPAVAIRLSDEFALSRFAVQLHGEHGRLVDVFAVGGRPAGPEEAVVLTATTPGLPAGVPASMQLLRAGRTIGRLLLTARRPLHQPQIAALSAAADLIAVATYNVELYEREQASVRRLRELDQLKDAFLGTISHELRTPITAIAGFVRLLRDRWGQVGDDQRLEFLERVHRNTLSLGLLVDDLLDFARLERQALNAPASPVQLDEAVAAIVAQLSPVLGDRHVDVEVQSVRALANTGALERVLANLLTNANKFSPAEGRITVRVCAQATTATVEVLDEGPGIAAADRDHVFTRFYRGESNAALSTRGAGIGLSVVRELVKQMGGYVVALPNTPQGTRMVVTLAKETTVSAVSDVPIQVRRIEPVPPTVIERTGT